MYGGLNIFYSCVGNIFSSSIINRSFRYITSRVRLIFSSIRVVFFSSNILTCSLIINISPFWLKLLSNKRLLWPSTQVNLASKNSTLLDILVLSCISAALPCVRFVPKKFLLRQMSIGYDKIISISLQIRVSKIKNLSEE